MSIPPKPRLSSESRQDSVALVALLAELRDRRVELRVGDDGLVELRSPRKLPKYILRAVGAANDQIVAMVGRLVTYQGGSAWR